MAPWLGLEFDAGGWTITDTGCARQILAAVDDPSSQCPSIQVFVGRAIKAQALRALHPHNNTGRHAKIGLARMHLTDSRSQPAILIDTSTSPSSLVQPPSAKPLHLYPIQDSYDRSYDDVRDLLFRHIMMPLADTVCLFAADLGGVEEIRTLLTAWGQAPVTSPDGSALVHARLIIVLTGSHGTTGAVQDIEITLREVAVPNIAAALSVVDLRDRDDLSPASQFEPLRQRLLRELGQAHSTRSRAHLLFSAVHLEWIFRKSLSHVAQWPATPFNCIESWRSDRLKGDEMAAQHLESFLRITDGARLPTDVLAAFIASAFLMDAYPPRMHGFDPIVMFRGLYAAHCRIACRRCSIGPETALCEQVESKFVSLFAAMSSALPSSQLRRDYLRQSMSEWAHVKSNHICLLCLRRPPEHVLACGHAICDICVGIFGHRGQGAEYHFKLALCPLCRKRLSLTVRLLPPTKRPTILVLDGGGIRGVVTLGFLRALEKQVVGVGGLREAFDLTVGTSAGALIATEVVICGSSVKVAHAKFKALAREIFPPRALPRTLLGQSWSFLRNWMADSRYDSDVLDQTLREAFTAVRRLFDNTHPLVSGIRVALTASQVEEDGSLCLFPNYRGAGRSYTRSAYKVLAPEGEGPHLWEVARCCVAALGYFTTKHLPNVGTFQDGGISANCPLRPAIRESEIIWPACTQPDLVISIGTGYPQEQSVSPAGGQRGFWSNRFIDRAIRTFLQSPAVNSRRGWQDAFDSLPDSLRPDVFRLDREVAGDLPELDDSHALDKLDEFPYHVPDQLTRAWLAKSFFFELDEEPTPVLGSYECRGSILCCKYNAANIVQRIATIFRHARFTFVHGSDLGAVEDGDGCPICGYYRRCVSFRVSSLHAAISLDIRGMVGSSAIGGFPTSIKSLLEAQQVDAPFGRADHRSDMWPPSRQCYCIRRKRVRKFTDSESPLKKRRLDNQLSKPLDMAGQDERAMSPSPRGGGQAAYTHRSLAEDIFVWKDTENFFINGTELGETRGYHWFLVEHFGLYKSLEDNESFEVDSFSLHNYT
ncbi:hypothetical protein BDV12DRAFT_203391 [Aspergillus spectabilis]